MHANVTVCVCVCVLHPLRAGVPVKIEHRGVNVGKVVSAWTHEGRMDVLMEIEDTHLEGALGKEFIRRGLCPELSLGYNVTMSKSPAGFLRATNKRVVELSIVKQGARAGCKIRAFTNNNSHHPSHRTASPFSSSSPPSPPAGPAKALHNATSSFEMRSGPNTLHRILV